MADLLHITIGDLLDEIVSRRGNGKGSIYPEGNSEVDLSPIPDECNRVAKGLMRLGLKKGDHLAIWATNHPEWLVTQFATGKMGAVMITVNTQLPEP